MLEEERRMGVGKSKRKGEMTAVAAAVAKAVVVTSCLLALASKRTGTITMLLIHGIQTLEEFRKVGICWYGAEFNNNQQIS